MSSRVVPKIADSELVPCPLWQDSLVLCVLASCLQERLSRPFRREHLFRCGVRLDTSGSFSLRSSRTLVCAGWISCSRYAGSVRRRARSAMCGPAGGGWGRPPLRGEGAPLVTGFRARPSRLCRWTVGPAAADTSVRLVPPGSVWLAVRPPWAFLRCGRSLQVVCPLC